MGAAQKLFLAKGFEATTIDEIAEHADISKRSFFDYFPTKEDVLVSWQDAFGDLLAAKVAQRPAGEALVRVVQIAMSEAIAESVSPEGVALDQMVRNTPSLKGHMHLKYSHLERRLAEALALRAPQEGDGPPVGKTALLAMIAVGALRLGSDAWRPTASGAELESYTQAIFDTLLQTLAELAGKA